MIEDTYNANEWLVYYINWHYKLMGISPGDWKYEMAIAEGVDYYLNEFQKYYKFNATDVPRERRD